MDSMISRIGSIMNHFIRKNLRRDYIRKCITAGNGNTVFSLWIDMIIFTTHALTVGNHLIIPFQFSLLPSFFFVS